MCEEIYHIFIGTVGRVGSSHLRTYARCGSDKIHTIVPQWKDKNHMCDSWWFQNSVLIFTPCLRWSGLSNIWRVEEFPSTCGLSWSALGAGASQALPDTVSWNMLKQRFMLENQLQEGAWWRAAALRFIGTSDGFKSQVTEAFQPLNGKTKKNGKHGWHPSPRKTGNHYSLGGRRFFFSIHHSSATCGAF